MLNNRVARLKFRYNKLTLWNKIGFWGSLCSIIGLILFLISSSLSVSNVIKDNHKEKFSLMDSIDNDLKEMKYGQSIDIGKLILFFLRDSRSTGGHDWSYGTSGELSPVQWDNNSVQDDMRIAAINRLGRVFIKIGDKLSNTTIKGIPVPWNIRLIGSERTVYGYDEIHFESTGGINKIEDDLKYSLSNVQVKFNIEECNCCTESIKIWNLNHDKFGKSMLIVNLSCGVGGCIADLFLYPFTNWQSCNKIYYENKLIGSMDENTLEMSPHKYPVRLIMGWTRSSDDALFEAMQFEKESQKRIEEYRKNNPSNNKVVK